MTTLKGLRCLIRRTQSRSRKRTNNLRRSSLWPHSDWVWRLILLIGFTEPIGRWWSRVIAMNLIYCTAQCGGRIAPKSSSAHTTKHITTCVWRLFSDLVQFTKQTRHLPGWPLLRCSQPWILTVINFRTLAAEYGEIDGWDRSSSSHPVRHRQNMQCPPSPLVWRGHRDHPTDRQRPLQNVLRFSDPPTDPSICFTIHRSIE